jgi:hypothetical protein
VDPVEMKAWQQKHMEKMLEVKKEIYLTTSWKRKKDLEKYLTRLEKEWFFKIRPTIEKLK